MYGKHTLETSNVLWTRNNVVFNTAKMQKNSNVYGYKGNWVPYGRRIQLVEIDQFNKIFYVCTV